MLKKEVWEHSYHPTTCLLRVKPNSNTKYCSDADARTKFLQFSQVAARRNSNEKSRSSSNVTIKSVLSNPNGLLRQSICHCYTQGRTLNGILTRVAH